MTPTLDHLAAFPTNHYFGTRSQNIFQRRLSQAQFSPYRNYSFGWKQSVYLTYFVLDGAGMSAHLLGRNKTFPARIATKKLCCDFHDLVAVLRLLNFFDFRCLSTAQAALHWFVPLIPFLK